MDTNKTERQNSQMTPFTYGDRAVRMVLLDDGAWFIAKDVCEALDIKQPTRAVEDFPESEKGVTAIHTLGGKQEMLIVNEPGLYRLIFQSRKPEAEKFKTWVFNEVLPQIRQTGGYGMHEDNGCACEIYRHFSACQNMTIQRMNKVIYYFALDPPLSNSDIAKLLGVSAATISLWRRSFSSELARNAVFEMGINAQGMIYLPEARPGFPLATPLLEANNARP